MFALLYWNHSWVELGSAQPLKGWEEWKPNSLKEINNFKWIKEYRERRGPWKARNMQKVNLLMSFVCLLCLHFILRAWIISALCVLSLRRVLYRSTIYFYCFSLSYRRMSVPPVMCHGRMYKDFNSIAKYKSQFFTHFFQRRYFHSNRFLWCLKTNNLAMRDYNLLETQLALFRWFICGAMVTQALSLLILTPRCQTRYWQLSFVSVLGEILKAI